MVALRGESGKNLTTIGKIKIYGYQALEKTFLKKVDK